MQQYKGEQTAVMTDFYGGRLSRANSSEDLKHENSSSASGFKPDKAANLESVNDLIHVLDFYLNIVKHIIVQKI